MIYLSYLRSESLKTPLYNVLFLFSNNNNVYFTGGITYIVWVDEGKILYCHVDTNIVKKHVGSKPSDTAQFYHNVIQYITKKNFF